MKDFLRLLVISDLHFNGEESIIADVKANVPQVSKFLTGSMKDKLFDIFKRICLNDIDHPDVIIVAGDLVEKGGLNINEFSQAKTFLLELAKFFNIDTKRIYIVPGNHDVFWDKSLDQIKKFNNFIEATKEFTSPAIVNNEFSALPVNLSNIVEGVKLELLLLVSPTFSGYGSNSDSGDVFDALTEKFIGKLKDNLTEEDRAIFNVIMKSIPDNDSLFDIAAIGTHQREMIGRNFSEKDSIKIAILHHHLLPASSIEVTNFESVIDSGKVLEKLIEKKFDMAITGHKHVEKLVHYQIHDSYIDVFSSPSLFHSSLDSGAGFCFLDIHNNNSPHYATITSYKTADPEYSKQKKLIREGRILSETKKICAEISPDNQKNYLNLVTPLIAKCMSWKDGKDFNVAYKPFFEKSYEYSMSFFKTMSEKKIIIQSPFHDKSWQDFIATINKLHAQRNTQNPNELRSVSDDDINYWMNAVNNTESDAYKYSVVLGTFVGVKKRIWILNKEDFNNPDARIMTIVEYMESTGYKVFKCNADIAKTIPDKDFSIIGDFCVSKWVNIDEERRELCESFDEMEIKIKNSYWNALMNRSKPFRIDE